MPQHRELPPETCRLTAYDHTAGRVLGCLSTAAFVLAVAPYSWAASVNVGAHVLLPNTANQIVTIQLTGGESVAGEDFYAQIGDGGTFLGGSDVKPAFANVDILTGTIFSASNNGAYGDPNGTPTGSNAGHPLVWIDGTTTASGGVPASGLLATLTIDTTGLNSGTFPLLVRGVASPLGSFDTTLRDASGNAIPLSISDGTLIVAVPLPGDYNRNGTVDAADYTVWRNDLGGTYSQGDYAVWKAHFGETLGGGSGASANLAVPEPATLTLLLLAAVAIKLRRRRFAWQAPRTRPGVQSSTNRSLFDTGRVCREVVRSLGLQQQAGCSCVGCPG
jgi:PEP-CTERM motif